MKPHNLQNLQQSDWAKQIENMKPKSSVMTSYDNEIQDGKLPFNNSQFLAKDPMPRCKTANKRTIDMKIDFNSTVPIKSKEFNTNVTNEFLDQQMNKTVNTNHLFATSNLDTADSYAFKRNNRKLRTNTQSMTSGMISQTDIHKNQCRPQTGGIRTRNNMSHVSASRLLTPFGST